MLIFNMFIFWEMVQPCNILFSTLSASLSWTQWSVLC
jgi:hypothetical protein